MQKTPWRNAFEPLESRSCMKSTLLRTFFEWALITSVLMSVGFFGWYWVTSHQARARNSQMATAQSAIQYNRAVMTMLLSECQAYGRTNADMARLLAPQSGASATATKPAAPAPTKPGAR
jgi:hypothetical protein